MSNVQQLPEVTYWVCGGTGINIADAIKQHAISTYNKDARFVGLDASNANQPASGFEVARIKLPSDPTQVAKGSGKIQSANYEAAQPFVDEVLPRFGASLYNVVVCNLAGGSGSLLALLTFRWLKKQDKTAVCIFIGEKGDLVSFRNSVNTLTWFSAQVKPEVLGKPVPYIEMWNDPKLTRGEMNKTVVSKADLLSLFMTEANGEMDFSDFQNLVEYSKYDIAPALSRITFHDQRIFSEGPDAAPFPPQFKERPPVAVASLFVSKDSIVSRFEGAGVRSPGVFPANDNRPSNMTELHMALDHGDGLRALEGQIAELEQKKTASANAFSQQKVATASKAADGNGISFG